MVPNEIDSPSGTTKPLMPDPAAASRALDTVCQGFGIPTSPLLPDASDGAELLSADALDAADEAEADELADDAELDAPLPEHPASANTRIPASAVSAMRLFFMARPSYIPKPPRLSQLFSAPMLVMLLWPGKTMVFSGS